MASICCSPPDSVPASWSRRSREPREAGVGDRPRSSAQDAPPWVAMPQVLAHGEVREDAPALGDRCTAPPRASSSGRCPVDPPAGQHDVAAGGCDAARAHTCSVVDLPAPFGPSRATTVPSGTREVDAVEHLDPAVAARMPRARAAARHAARQRVDGRLMRAPPRRGRPSSTASVGLDLVPACRWR